MESHRSLKILSCGRTVRFLSYYNQNRRDRFGRDDGCYTDCADRSFIRKGCPFRTAFCLRGDQDVFQVDGGFSCFGAESCRRRLRATRKTTTATAPTANRIRTSMLKASSMMGASISVTSFFFQCTKKSRFPQVNTCKKNRNVLYCLYIENASTRMVAILQPSERTGHRLKARLPLDFVKFRLRAAFLNLLQ